MNALRSTGSSSGANYFKLFGASTISNLGDGIGIIAYPWLASAVTRNPLLIALVVVVQRLPWLIFSLPAGVITDRYDRRTSDGCVELARTVLTVASRSSCSCRKDGLPAPTPCRCSTRHHDRHVPVRR